MREPQPFAVVLSIWRPSREEHAMPCVPTFSIIPHDTEGFVVVAAWPKGHVDQLVGVFDSPDHAERWVARHAAEFIAQLGPPSRRVSSMDDYRKR